ncbi:GntR family transcriptional regulator [Sinirhodobacter populi]|uniref:GntR family transcriptional regulator n=1 Tax=Paenirhodobacter populi TaxID=2306993 RepID=A0A443K6C0_9RHOB|nr:GntR family transcriptional regulator [Sinirhodobacter populi]RWR28318.1 GntR family transcriptional regulator [Sinirhodobacter populi]
MSQSLSARAHARIIGMILSQQLPPGAALQEEKLADWLDMSRTPVREALKRIEAEGLARKDGRFLRVRQLTMAEVREIFTLRAALEGFGARQAVHLPRARLDEMADRVQALMRTGESEEQRRVDDDFHAMIARASGNATLERTIADLRLRTCMFDIHQVPERFAQGCSEHLGILDALAAGDAGLAEDRMVAHLRNAGAAVLGRLETLEAERTT